ncbi:MAG: hypothetical protein MOB07_19115 [Acidobacteria bacterium]|nr:hypothetical protein [Acidobacteriota bacterium]
MKIIRSIASVLAGYLVFALGSSTFVYVWFIQRRSAADTVSILLSVICLAAIGFACGFVTSLLAGRRALLHCGIVAALVALVTIGNLLMGVAAEPVWYKALVFVVLVPALLLRAYLKRGGVQ